MNGILQSLLIASRIVKAASIRELARVLPQDCAFLVQKLGTRTSDAGLRLEVCLSEPRFGYFFVMHYVTTKTSLPPSVLEPTLQRAYYHRRYRQSDEAVENAFALNHPGNKHRPV